MTVGESTTGYDRRQLTGGTVLAWGIGLGYLTLLGSEVVAAALTVVVLAASVLVVGPSEFDDRARYGVAAGVVAVLAAALVPAAIRGLTDLDPAFRLVSSLVAAVAVLAVGLYLVGRYVLPTGDAAEGGARSTE